MRERPRRLGIHGMRIVYTAAAAVMVFSLMQSGQARSFIVSGILLASVVPLIFARMDPVYRLALGLTTILVVGLGAQSLSLPPLLAVSYSALFLLAFTVPTWLTPASLSLLFIVLAWRLEPTIGLKLANVAGIGLEAFAFGMLAHQQKKLERQRRNLNTTSGELTQSLKQVEYLAYHDALTGLPNRRMMTQQLEQTLVNAQSHGTVLAVTFVDLDRFKAVNDGAGHQFGDRLLKAVAATISRSLAYGDIIGRQGGDEFILVMESTNEEAAYARVDGVRQNLAEGVVVDGERVFCTASFGIAFYPKNGLGSHELLRNADLALYRAKDNGRNRAVIFSDELEQEASAAYYLDAALHRALSESQFFLEYQPQVDILTGRLIGIEALLRWKTEDGRLIMPDAFLPEAQKLGLMEHIDLWVLEHAVEEISRMSWWHLEPVTLAVNISATSLDSPEFIDHFLKILPACGVPPERVEIEITESAASRNAETAVSRLAELRQRGIGVAVDDFGVGYSSLSYLKNLPVTRIKIDRSFVADLIHSDSIARAIIAVAKSLHLDVVAEGVETRSQAEHLLKIGCDLAQGYYYHRSVRANDLRLKYTPEAAESPA